MGGDSRSAALRRCVLAVSVVDDIDLRPRDAGVTLDGTPPVMIDWDEIRVAIGHSDPESEVARVRLSRWFTQRRWIANRPHAELRELARPIGFPVGDERHPG